MKKALFDTNILIDHLKGRKEAADLLYSCLQQKMILACSVVTKIELLSGILPNEKKHLELFLSGFEQIEVSNSIAEAAGKYMNQFRKSHGVNIADAIIAATAKETEASLYTLNIKHYPMTDIIISKPY